LKNNQHLSTSNKKQIMAELKTKENDASVEAFLNSIEHDGKRADGYRLKEIMEAETGEPARMWGESIIGFGHWQYKYASGREGDWFVCGFSPRKTKISLYMMMDLEPLSDCLARFGKYKTGASCIYVNKLKDVDEAVLREMIQITRQHHRND
jgi:hypothetical protein